MLDHKLCNSNLLTTNIMALGCVHSFEKQPSGQYDISFLTVGMNKTGGADSMSASLLYAPQPFYPVDKMGPQQVNSSTKPLLNLS